MSQREEDRFAYASNLGQAGSYRDHRAAFWPPAATYRPVPLDLDELLPGFGDEFRNALADLRAVIDAEWARAKDHGIAQRRRLADPVGAAAVLRRLAGQLPGENDRQALSLRADAVEHGYNDDILKRLVTIEEEVTVIAGQISTWYGKDLRGLPTAFACRRDDRRQSDVHRALEFLPEAHEYVRGLHPDLSIGDLPAFGATQLFFMAGEGNLHPKHIAYFLPEDEGVKYSPFKKTYYFHNTHRALIRDVSAPLAAELLDFDVSFVPQESRFDVIPTLGVLSHESGHFVHRPTTAFQAINEADRWASVVLQEVAADVFGMLILADVWAERLGIARGDVLAYYLGECLRYVSRGLGHFPDSDGMFLQLNYFVQVGALRWDGARLVGDHGSVGAALRSLARVLADFLLAGDADRAVRLYQAYGPATAAPLQGLVDAMRSRPAASVEYGQDRTTAVTADQGTAW